MTASPRLMPIRTSVWICPHKTGKTIFAHGSQDLILSLGAGWSDGYTQQVHRSFSQGNLSMTSYAFAPPETMKAFGSVNCARLRDFGFWP